MLLVGRSLLCRCFVPNFSQDEEDEEESDNEDSEDEHEAALECDPEHRTAT
jgi:hypothetical protein